MTVEYANRWWKQYIIDSEKGNKIFISLSRKVYKWLNIKKMYFVVLQKMKPSALLISCRLWDLRELEKLLFISFLDSWLTGCLGLVGMETHSWDYGNTCGILSDFPSYFKKHLSAHRRTHLSAWENMQVQIFPICTSSDLFCLPQWGSMGQNKGTICRLLLTQAKSNEKPRFQLQR